MDVQATFGLSILMSFVAFGLVTRFYIWPRLRMPGVVSPSLPSAFAAPAAYGDLVAVVLAVAASLAPARRAPPA